MLLFQQLNSTTRLRSRGIMAQNPGTAPTGTAPTHGEHTSAVSLRGVEKRFGDFTAVKDLDIEIHDGEFFSMLGPSGSGKTTVLRMIAGFEEPTAGKIVLHGSDVTNAAPF